MAVPVTATSLRLQERPPFGDSGFVTFDGGSGNCLIAADAPELDIIADIAVTVRVNLDDMTPAAKQTIVSKLTTTGNQRSWALSIMTNGTVEFLWSTDGAIGGPTMVSTSSLADHTGWLWIKFTLDVDNGASGRTGVYATSGDGLTYTPLGDPITQDGVTSIFSSSAPVVIGAVNSGGAQMMAGDVSHVSISDASGRVLHWTGYSITDLSAPLVAWTGQTLTPQGTVTVTAAVLVNPGVPVGVGEWRLVVEQLVGTGFVWGAFKWGTPDPVTGLMPKWGTLGWQPITDWRGIEWARGADQPFGRPRNGEIHLTLDANTVVDGVRRYDPVGQYSRTRPGNVIRAGLVSATDPRADGWIPLWTGIVESWELLSQDGVDYRAEVTLIETLSALARIDANAGLSQGGGETAQPRFERLLAAANWKYGFIYAAGLQETITLQSTDMAKPRLEECYLTADSAANVIRSDITGAAIVTDIEKFSFATPSRLSDFSHVAGSPDSARIRFRPITENLAAIEKSIVYDLDSLVVAQDDTAIVNDHRYARVGGTQQLAVHDVSIGRFGHVSRARNDLISTADLHALGVARDDNDREAVTSVRVDNFMVTATGKGEYYLLVAAVDISNEAIVVIDEFDVDVKGPIRSMTHSVTPMVGRVHWTASYALDNRTLTGFPPGSQLDPLPPPE